MLDFLSLLPEAEKALNELIGIYKEHKIYGQGVSAARLEELEKVVDALRLANRERDRIRKLIARGLYDESQDPNNRTSEHGLSGVPADQLYHDG